MTVYYNVTNFSEATSGDTENSDSIAGRSPSDANFPVLNGNGGTFSGTIGNSRLSAAKYDSDYFAIDVAGGSHDWAGSIAKTANLNFKVQLSSPLPSGADFTIEYYLVDYNFLNKTGPYGNYEFYSQADQRGSGVLSASSWFNTSRANAPSGDYVLVFQVIPYGYQGNYTITVSSGGSSGGGGTTPPPVQQVDLSASISLSTTSVKPGDQLKVKTTITNGGTAAAPSEHVGYYISADPTFASGVTSLGQITIDPLAAKHATVYPNIVVPIPSNFRPGKYYIRAIADVDGKIVESNEGNNASKAVAITLLNRPPVLVDDYIPVTNLSGGTSHNILLADHDPDGDTLTLVAVGKPARGTVTFSPDGEVIYTPNAGLSPADADIDGVIRDHFSAKVSDGHGGYTTENVAVEILPKHFDVDLGPLPTFTAPAVTRRSVSQASSPTIPRSTPVSRNIPAGNLMAGTSVTYHFTASPFVTQYMDYHGDSKSSPTLKADPSNFEPDLQNSRGSSADIGFGDDPTWYDDPLMPGKYTIELTNNGDPNTFMHYQIDRTIAPDYAGNSPLWARDLGTVPNKTTASYAELVSRGDGTDYYKFTLGSASAVSIAFVTKNTLAPAHIYIDDAASVAAGSTAGIPTGFTKYAEGADFQVLTTSGRATALAAGTYYFHVDHPTGYDFDAEYGDGLSAAEEAREPYKVFVTAWTDNAGNTSEQASQLGKLTNTTKTLKDSVSLADASDWYKFDITSASTFSASLKTTNKSFKIGIELARFSPVEQSFTTIARAGADGNATGFGPNVQLETGTYYVRVFANSDLTASLIKGTDYSAPFIYPAQGGTDYQLTLTAKGIPPATPAAPTLTTASDTGVSSTDGITNKATPTLTGTAKAGTTVTLYDGTKLVGTGTADTQTGAYSITTSTLADGTHKLTVKATDYDGNVSALSAAKTVLIDTKVPIATITTKSATVKTATVTISGKGEVGSTITLTDNGDAIGAPVTVSSKGTWSAKITLAAGANSLVATDTDKAGNVGTSAAITLQYGDAAQASSMHNMVQAMAVMTPSSSADVAPSAPPPTSETHLAAAHA